MKLDTRFLFLNVGHAIDHLLMLLFPTLAVVMIVNSEDSYASSLILSTGSFIAFGTFSLLAGWLADRWSRENMMTIFFIGIGIMTAGISLLSDPIHIAIGLFLIGVFAAIYHPVGIAMVSQGGGQVGKRLGVNGVWGNMGVALAAPVAWGLAEFGGWQTAFLVCGGISVTIGVAWMLYLRGEAGRAEVAHGQAVRKKKTEPAANWKQVLIVVAIATAFGGFIFNSTTVALPKVFDERVMAVTENATQAGGLVAAVFAVAAFTQVLVGYLIDRYSIKMVFLALSVADIAIFVIASSATGSLMFATALAMMAMVFGQIPITDTLVARNTPEAWRARVYSVKYVISFVVAATVVPSIAYLHEFAEGFTDLFMICAVCATVISLAVLMLPSVKPPVAEAAGDD